MSDYLQALAISHAGKDWAFLSNNVLKNVRINDKNNDVEVKHIVFTLPRSKMKSNPSVFGDWQVSEEGCQESIAYRATFLFFLDLFCICVSGSFCGVIFCIFYLVCKF